MRKTLYAMVGLLALGLWALPALAEDIDLPKAHEPIPLENRAGRLGAMSRGGEAAFKGTLSGTLIKQAQATTSWFLYPGACNQRNNPGTYGAWAPYLAGPVADSMNAPTSPPGYNVLTQNHGYFLEDQSLKERLWHISNGSGTIGLPAGLPIDGANSLWCGKTDNNWVVKSGYPNLTFQILYFDTDKSAAGGGAARAGAFALDWTMNLSTEFNYDYMYIIAGVGATPPMKDPICNSRAILDKVISAGSDPGGELLATFTGSQNANSALTYTPGVGSPVVHGLAAGAPVTVTVSLGPIPATRRAIYFLFVADCLFSSEDGLWPEGHGAWLDLVNTSDQGFLYDDQTTAGGTDGCSGDVLVGTPGNPLISARVAPGVGTLWQIAAGSTLPTGDFCSPQKGLTADIEFLGGDGTSKLTIANTFASVKTCTFGIPTGTASVLTLWGEYLDLPRQSGYVQYAEYRVRKLPDDWGNWQNSAGSSSVRTGALQAWTRDGDELANATQADSIQIRYNMQCINFFAVDHVNCQPVTYGVLYDDFRLQILTGVPAPVFSVFVGQVPQSNFVDGTDGTVGCSAGQLAAAQCWPGGRGSNLAGLISVHDNVNGPLGDSIVVNMLTGLVKNGMGINWHNGFDKTVSAGLTIAHVNTVTYNPAFDVPRIIFRLFDPATLTWSPWDSSELDADAAQPDGAGSFIVINSSFRYNWPPRDKVAAAASLPGGFSLGPYPGGARTLYSQLAFLPKGCRMQYYYKAVDINGGVSYQFSSDALGLEVEDLPLTPGNPPTNPASGPVAPDIIEMDILPRVYPAGAGGTLLAGKSDTPILNLDGNYTSWSNGFDPVTQALRAMGVRADRYRFLQGLGEGNNIGGHELPGQRQDRLSNYFPNIGEYNILTKLANQYKIMIQSSHLRSSTIYEEQDAILLHNWWMTDTGLDGGDRCILGTGDDMFNALLNASLSFPQHTQQVSLAQDVFGVASVIGAWTGANTNQYPTITDNFAGIPYPIDGGCPNPNRFDGFTAGGSADITVAATYPGGVTELAGVARSTETDALGSTDNDRGKALAYGFSIQFIRTAGIPTTAANYVHTGVENRMRVMYKFLTSCRGARTPLQTGLCWPCPSSFAEITSNWAGASGFNTAVNGPLYPIQDNTQATGVELVEAPKVNRLEGAFPNPFNPETAIRFSAATTGKVTIRVFDVAGRVVNTLTKNVTETGINELRWNGKAQDGRALASGVYFYKIRFANGQESEAKMTMLK